MADFKINIITDASSAVSGGKQAAEALKGVANEAERYQTKLREMAITEKSAAEERRRAADDSERYAATLEKMAVAQGKSREISQEDASLLEKSAALQEKLAERKRLTTEADEEIAAGVKKVSKEEIEAAGISMEADKATLTRKAEIQQALSKLSREFPVAASAAKALFSGIGGAAMLAAWGFKKLQGDIENLMAALEPSQWATYGSVVAARKADFEAAATGAAGFARELEQTKLMAESASAASEKLVTVFKARQSAQEKVDAAAKDLELARAGGIKDPVQRAQAVLEIENRYAERSRRRQEETANFERNEQHRKIGNERIAVEMLDKQLEGAREKQKGLKSEGEVTEEIKVARDRLNTINNEYITKQERFEALKGKGWAFRSTPEQMEMEQLGGQLDSLFAQRQAQQGIVGSLEAGAPGAIGKWRSSAEHIQMLEGMRRGAGERLGGMISNLPTSEALFGIESGARSAVGNLEDRSRLQTAANQAAANASQAEAATQAAIEKGAGASMTTLNLMISFAQLQADIERRMKQLESRNTVGVRGAQ